MTDLNINNSPDVENSLFWELLVQDGAAGVDATSFTLFPDWEADTTTPTNSSKAYSEGEYAVDAVDSLIYAAVKDLAVADKTRPGLNATGSSREWILAFQRHPLIANVKSSDGAFALLGHNTIALVELSSTITITLPEVPFIGQKVALLDVLGQGGTFETTINAFSTETIDGKSSLTLSRDNFNVTLMYVATDNWSLVSEDDRVHVLGADYVQLLTGFQLRAMSALFGTVAETLTVTISDTSSSDLNAGVNLDTSNALFVQNSLVLGSDDKALASEGATVSGELRPSPFTGDSDKNIDQIIDGLLIDSATSYAQTTARWDRPGFFIIDMGTPLDVVEIRYAHLNTLLFRSGWGGSDGLAITASSTDSTVSDSSVVTLFDGTLSASSDVSTELLDPFVQNTLTGNRQVETITVEGTNLRYFKFVLGEFGLREKSDGTFGSPIADYVGEIEIRENEPATELNTFEVPFADGIADFSRPSFKALDSSSSALANASLMFSESLNGTSFTDLLSFAAFSALGVVSVTSGYKLRLALLGAATYSSGAMDSPITNVTIASGKLTRTISGIPQFDNSLPASEVFGYLDTSETITSTSSALQFATFTDYSDGIFTTDTGEFVTVFAGEVEVSFYGTINSKDPSTNEVTAVELELQNNSTAVPRSKTTVRINGRSESAVVGANFYRRVRVEVALADVFSLHTVRTEGTADVIVDHNEMTFQIRRIK